MILFIESSVFGSGFALPPSGVSLDLLANGRTAIL